MAIATETRTAQPVLALEISAAVHHLIQRLADFRAYRATVTELSKLDDRTLADLGIPRSGIRGAARYAVYGVSN